ncbi:hypothetical protein Mnod_8203 (plasmid) [Methylobacterium nodulans ORS 2060]|uniref:Uncharacterized protein n=1 Tax=Methylobacterium nodulans (strain LMG 21967 / CNCM I-2342 / ORS 2060) TaxID=460265 RepID=B8IXD6_METNO|nr:hypothetical protein Mnod_8203 [Methylobacterium nodulans ORS 2060]
MGRLWDGGGKLGGYASRRVNALTFATSVDGPDGASGKQCSTVGFCTRRQSVLISGAATAPPM